MQYTNYCKYVASEMTSS